jgi:hypothetical protein
MALRGFGRKDGLDDLPHFNFHPAMIEVFNLQTIEEL